MLNLGPKIRELRKTKKITLVELADKTGVAQATLSRIETGVMIGTVESHQKISEALGVNLAELYSGVDSRAEKIALVKPGERAPKKMGKATIEILTTSVSQKKMLPALIKLETGSEVSFEKEEVGVEKFLYCVRGEIALSLGNLEYRLKAGESLYFDASLAHSAKCPAGKTAELFSVTSPAKI